MRKNLVLLTALALLCALLPAAPAAAQHQDGCPRGEFTIDGCVLCIGGVPPTPTGNTGNNGKACYTCLRGGGDASPIPPEEIPDGCVIVAYPDWQPVSPKAVVLQSPADEPPQNDCR